ncbi:MAG: (Fe-S)-binding protein [Desulfotalea sp.]
MNKSLKDFQTEIDKCVKCGVCHAHCPAYLTNKKEGSVARGKISLAAAVLNGETDLAQSLQDDFSMCLMCGSCVNKCPQKVPTHEIVGAVRREISKEKGLSKIGKGVSTVLGSRTILKTLTKAGGLFMPMLCKSVPESSGLRLRFPSPVMKGRSMPKLPVKNLFDLVPEWIQGEGGKPTIGFFAGCSISYVYPEIGLAMINILKSMKYSIYIPRKQMCCGIPALSSGDGQLVEKLASTNIEAFTKNNVDHIITACASCHGGINDYYQTMKMENTDFTEKVIEFSVFLKDSGYFEDLAKINFVGKKLNVTYHDPCHLKTQGITQEPRELLKLLPNVNYVEMDGADQCCGLGGTFSVYHYEESKAIGARKMESLLESGAEIVATSCPGCIIQLQDSINHAGLKIKAVHILELIAAATKGDKDD